MFKKFHWGHGIALFYVVFALVMGSALFASFGVDHSLVDDNYYQKDLQFQSQYDKEVKSLSTDKLRVARQADQNRVVVSFEGVEKLKGVAHFYRPSDQSKDFNVSIDNGITYIQTKDMLPGKWIVKLELEADGESYYKEQMLFI